MVQDIIIEARNTRYRLERWEAPDGSYITGELPSEIHGNHFGPTLRSYILYQYYHSHVTQPLILESLREFGIDISSGQLSRLITENKERFQQEKKAILLAGLGVSKYINVDDTSARHMGKNGYCTHIGNEYFAWFESSESKSRINFLKLLNGGEANYVINQDALDYMKEHKLPKSKLAIVSQLMGTGFECESEWAACLEGLNISGKRHIQIITEGALVGGVIENGLNKELVIVSDDAGQFDVFLHALCWIHAERSINKLTGFSSDKRNALENKRAEIWSFYAELGAYKLSPCKEKKTALELRFDEIFKEKTCFASLNLALGRIHKNKSELLLVLDRPEIPLHNNLSENDIREFVKKRKISGSTRSESGKRGRDTFASLKKTCRKLGLSFWEYIKDRLKGNNSIPSIPDLITAQAQRDGP